MKRVSAWVGGMWLPLNKEEGEGEEEEKEEVGEEEEKVGEEEEEEWGLFQSS